LGKKKFYITTAIAYLNGPPHMGHALEIIQADCLARFYRLFGEDVVFQTGSDEHGVKIYTTALKHNMDVKDFIEQYYKEFIRLYRKLNISYDRYCRTTSKIHEKGVIKFWKKMRENGDLEKSFYSGLYCVGCESFKTSSELENGVCPFHPNRELVEVKEENYFFKLSKYKEKLLNIYKNNEIEIIPERRKAEIVGILNSELSDISFSRIKSKMPWGIPVPDDPEHVIYVWADALANYITNVGYEYNEEEFNQIWPADIHVIGKDITKFHAIYWPAMLLSAGVPLFKKLFVHGFITIEGAKIGKSLGNAVDPFALIDKYGVDTFRFYILKNIPSYDDGSFIENDLINVHNQNLANDLGNLVLRVHTFIDRDFNKKIPPIKKIEEQDREFIKKFDFTSELREYIDKFQINKALNRIWDFVKITNKYINDTKPWDLLKKGNIDRCSTVIHILAEAIRVIAIYISPFMPQSAEEIIQMMGAPKFRTFQDAKFNESANWEIGSRKILYKKIEKIKIDPLQNFDFKVGKVIDVEEHYDSPDIYVLTIDLGNAQKIICAKIAKYFSIQDLLGKTFVVLTNIKPRNIKGIQSEGMLIGAMDPSSKTMKIAEIEGAPGEQIHIGDLEPIPSQITAKRVNKTKIKVEQNKIKIQDKFLKTKKHYATIDLPDGIQLS